MRAWRKTNRAGCPRCCSGTLCSTIVGYTFTIGLRGYDRTEVDALIARAEAAIASGSSEERAEVKAAVERGLKVALRGYDRQQVDDFLSRVIATMSV